MPSPAVITDRCGDVALPVNPFVSNRYHFGMLLGVADLEAEQAYHRGKAWLHNAWMHGIGVVWGLDVEVRADHNEVVVHAGLAIDGHGRELSVTDTMCVDLGAWFAERRPDDLEVETLPDGDVRFTVHVELCHDSCLDRPVPSISEPCEDASFDTAYSRAVERGLPRLVVPRPGPDFAYPLLRQFFGQLPATDPLVIEARAAVDAAADDDRAATCVRWFRRVAAADVTALAPEEGAPSWSPIAGDGCVPLAELQVRLRPDGDGFTVVEDGADGTTVDTLIRPSHVRTRTIQELLCHHGGAAAAPGDGGEEGDGEEGDGEEGDGEEGDGEEGGGEEDGGEGPVRETRPGLRVVRDSAEVAGASIELTFTAGVDPRTVRPPAFEVSVLRTDGWRAATIRRVSVAGDDGRIVVIELPGAPRSRPLRIVARGTGTAPLLSTDGAVLTGVEGDPLVRSGSDAALMITDTGTPEED